MSSVSHSMSTPEKPTEPTGTTERRWWPIVLIIAIVAVLCAVLIRKSYLRDDDFLNAGVARRYGFSWPLFRFNGFGHLAPIDRLIHLLWMNVSSFSYNVAAVLIVAMFVGLLVSLWWVLVELQVPTVVVACVVGFVGTSVIVLHIALWFDQAAFLMPASSFILVVVASYLRWERTGRSRWLIVSWILFSLSFLTQERPLVVLAYLLLLRYVVVRPHGTYFSRRILGDWRLWIPYAAIAAIYLWIYVAGGYFQRKPMPSTSQILDYLRLVGIEFPRALIGLPSIGAPQWTTDVLLLTTAVLIVAIVRLALRDSRAWKASVFAIVCFLVNVFPVMSGRVGIYGPLPVATDIQYLLDPMLSLAIAVGIGTSRWLVDPSRHRHAFRPDLAGRHATSAGIGVVGGIVAALLIIVHLTIVPTGINHELGVENSAATVRNFVNNLRSGLTSVDRMSGKATILPMIAPEQVVPAFLSPYNFEGLVFPILPEWHDYQTGPVLAVGSDGTLVATTSSDTAVVAGQDVRGSSVWTNIVPVDSPPGETCARGNEKTGGLTINLPTTVSGTAIGADIHLSSNRSFVGTLGTAASTTSVYNALATTFPAGQSKRVVTWVEGSTADRLLITSITPDSRFCIASVQVGSMVTFPDASGVCHAIDDDGGLGRPTFCGVVWH